MIVSKIFDIFRLLADWFNVENLRSNAIKICLYLPVFNMHITGNAWSKRVDFSL